MSDTLFSDPGIQDTLDGDPLARQLRLAEVQVANWGTFDGLHRIPVARKGHLITGASGSGKSSLLDAIAAVLTPDKWLNFNQAAVGGAARANQRTKMSYVRGAWRRTSDEFEDRVVTDFLRSGPTWSGIILVYTDKMGATVSLGRLFFAKGTGTGNADLSSVRMFSKTRLDLADFEEYLLTGVETRRIQKAFPHVEVTRSGSYAGFFRRVLSTFGLADEEALQLLHKTQSTKNLGSLDDLFRTYMLDVPKTFEVAENAVSQFTELSSAYSQVVELRKQRDHLRNLREVAQKYEADLGEARNLEVLASAVRTYEAELELSLAEEELVRVVERESAAQDEARAARDRTMRAEERLDTAREKNSRLGGADVAGLQVRIEDAEKALRDTERRQASFVRLLASAGVQSVPATRADFDALVLEVGKTMDEGASTQPKGATHEQMARMMRARAKVRDLETEFDSVRRTGSTIPPRLQEVRKDLAGELGVDEGVARDLLPFVGELIDVLPEEAKWTGAIERALGAFGLTLLVRPEYLGAVRRHVDSHHLGVRLEYEEVGQTGRGAPSPSAPHSLVRKLKVKDGYFQPWLEGTLARRFDYSCVLTADDLGNYVPSLSLNGQMRLSKHRYVKDDRSAITDRSRWVLGDHVSKLQELDEALRRARNKEKEAERIVDAAQKRQQRAQLQRANQQRILEQHWEDIDVAAAEARVASLKERLTTLTSGNQDLAESARELEHAKAALNAAQRAAADATAEATKAQVRRENLEDTIKSLESLNLEPLPDPVRDELKKRFSRGRRSISRSQVPAVAGRVDKELRRDHRAAASRAENGSRRLTSLQTVFKQKWPATAGDLTDQLADRDGYLTILASIEAKGLPEHEQRFLNLFRDRSRDLVSTLSAEITQAFSEVRERVYPINQALKTVPYERGKYLRLHPKSSRPRVAEEFLADLKSITAQTVGEEDMEVAEPRYQILERIMTDLGSSDHQMKVWRRNCLDTRLHVSFLAEEVNEDGTVFQTLDTGVALSGGQQQKLAFFCLAAALKFKLTDADQPYPKFGTVVLDEAFDRADADYTRTALEVFKTFGLHLVVATPQKLLQTIEPYIGGATQVENPERSSSRVAAVQWEEAS